MGFSGAKKVRVDVRPSEPRFESLDDSEKWPQLSKAAKIVLCVLPSPANTERAFSKASFFTESRKNKLSCEFIKTRLIASCD